MKYDLIRPLIAPDSFWSLDPKIKKDICNGIGPKGLGWLFPNTVWGLNVSAAGNIHDYQYHIGTVLEDKMKADEAFLENLHVLIESKTDSWKWVRTRRLIRAGLMYKAVTTFGERAFWANKT